MIGLVCDDIFDIGLWRRAGDTTRGHAGQRGTHSRRLQDPPALLSVSDEESVPLRRLLHLAGPQARPPNPACPGRSNGDPMTAADILPSGDAGVVQLLSRHHP